MIPGVPEADVDGYFDQAKPYIKALMLSAKVIVTLLVKRKKPASLAIGDVVVAQDITR